MPLLATSPEDFSEAPQSILQGPAHVWSRRPDSTLHKARAESDVHHSHASVRSSIVPETNSLGSMVFKHLASTMSTTSAPALLNRSLSLWFTAVRKFGEPRPV